MESKCPDVPDDMNPQILYMLEGSHFENTPIQAYRKFLPKKLKKKKKKKKKKSDTKNNIFHISSQNIDCGTL